MSKCHFCISFQLFLFIQFHFKHLFDNTNCNIQTKRKIAVCWFLFYFIFPFALHTYKTILPHFIFICEIEIKFNYDGENFWNILLSMWLFWFCSIHQATIVLCNKNCHQSSQLPNKPHYVDYVQSIWGSVLFLFLIIIIIINFYFHSNTPIICDMCMSQQQNAEFCSNIRLVYS